jgi:hypothetical protein
LGSDELVRIYIARAAGAATTAGVIGVDDHERRYE